jgi:hypothetical protein
MEYVKNGVHVTTNTMESFSADYKTRSKQSREIAQIHRDYLRLQERINEKPSTQPGEMFHDISGATSMEIPDAYNEPSLLSCLREVRKIKRNQKQTRIDPVTASDINNE